MSEKETSFPYEASDGEKQGRFYPDSLKPEKPQENDDFLSDPAEETGNTGEMGGGYNSLNDGSLNPADINPNLGPDWRLTNQQRQTGRNEVKRVREALDSTDQN